MGNASRRVIRAGAAVTLLLVLGRAESKEAPKPAGVSREQSAAIAAALARKGWKEAKEAAPDRALLELRPSAFAKPTKAALAALRGQAFGGESLAKLRTLLHADVDPRVRALVLDAIATSPDPRAQPILVESYRGASERDKARILDRLDPWEKDPAGFDLLRGEAKSGGTARIRAAAAARLRTLKLVKGRDAKLGKERLDALPPDLRKSLEPIPGKLPAPPRPKKVELPEKPEPLPCDAEPKRPTATVIRKTDPGKLPSEIELPDGVDAPSGRIDDRGRIVEPIEKHTIDSQELRSTRTPKLGSAGIDPSGPSHTFLRVGGEEDGEDDGKFLKPSGAQIAKPGKYRQVVIFPTGYEVAEYDKFHQDARRMICDMATLPRPVFTAGHRARIVYVLRWLPGGEIGTQTATFRAELFDHPVRGGKGVTLRNRRVVDAVADLRTKVTTLDPIGVIVLVDVDDRVTANASPPTFLRAQFPDVSFGIARVTRQNVYDEGEFLEDRDDLSATERNLRWGRMVPMHELAHASLNFLDEYFERSFQWLTGGTLDALTPLLVLDASWGGVRDAWEDLIGNYDLRVSEILANNGSSHIATRSRPATVGNDPCDYGCYAFDNEGGMFLTAGTFHAVGNNVMNDDPFGVDEEDWKVNGDRFGWRHSRAQRHVVDQVFGVDDDTTARRPNDRLRNAGPLHPWLPQWGDDVRLLLHDADKNHRWHPTKRYDVRVGWWQLDLSNCPATTCIPGSGFDAGRCAIALGVSALELRIPASCDPTNANNLVWRTMTREFTPTRRTIDLSRLIAADAIGGLQFLLVNAGIEEIEPTAGSPINLAAMTLGEVLDVALPAVQWATPYQDVAIDLPTGRYFFKFRTDNGDERSGWTPYTEFTVVGP